MKKSLLFILLVTAGATSQFAQADYPPAFVSTVGTFIAGAATTHLPIEVSKASKNTSYSFRMREQIVANAEQIAVLNQVYTAQMSELVKSARESLVEVVGANKVSSMTDQEILATLIAE